MTTWVCPSTLLTGIEVIGVGRGVQHRVVEGAGAPVVPPRLGARELAREVIERDRGGDGGVVHLQARHVGPERAEGVALVGAEVAVDRGQEADAARDPLQLGIVTVERSCAAPAG
jgi:hypothetical protein